MSRHLYTLLCSLLLPLALARLWWRGRREAGYRRSIGERLGRYPAGGEFAGAWWIHAVSVGETRAVAPLVEALLATPGARVLLTHMTPTGRRTAEQLFAQHRERVRLAYLPYDLPWLAERFLERFRPRAAILMETELWPNHLLAARRRGIPCVLANARLSERSARRYRRVGRLARESFGALSAVSAQTREDAERLHALGAPRPEVNGNLKFDVQPPAGLDALRAALSGIVGSRRVLLAASTREGEEQEILQAFAAQGGAEQLLVVVPRHPQRFDEVARCAEACGLALERRSSAGVLRAGTRVLLGDSMGEMFGYYAIARAAMIGGSWRALGGQNLIEACAVGTPVVVGPHTFNFSEATRLAIEAGAAVRAGSAAEGIAALIEIDADERRRAEMSQAARAFCAAHGGATGRTLALIRRIAPQAQEDSSANSRSS